MAYRRKTSVMRPLHRINSIDTGRYHERGGMKKGENCVTEKYCDNLRKSSGETRPKYSITMRQVCAFLSGGGKISFAEGR
jgi:hypothetical protein